jgi:hypothetical protein
VYSHEIIDETRTDNDSKRHLHSRLFVHTLSIAFIDDEASKSDNVPQYVMSPRTITCKDPQGAAAIA